MVRREFLSETLSLILCSSDNASDTSLESNTFWEYIHVDLIHYDVNIRLMKRQKTFVFDSDTESENCTYCAGACSLTSRETVWKQRFTKIRRFYN